MGGRPPKQIPVVISSGDFMKTPIRSMIHSLLAAGALAATVIALAPTGIAQAPAGAPAGATGLCNDGSYWTGASKSGACRGHKGIKTWYAATPSSAAAPAAAAPAPAPAATPAPKAAMAMKPTSTTPAPGGGPGLVWLNTSTKVYHCPRHQVLWHHQSRLLYDGSRGESQGRPPRRRQTLQLTTARRPFCPQPERAPRPYRYRLSASL